MALDAWGSDGPYFDDLEKDFTFGVPTPVTVTNGLTGQYLAISGEDMPLTIDAELCEDVTGSSSLLVSPTLVMHLSIGASTVATKKVLANLFYRRVVLRRPVFVGDCLRTETTVKALANSRPKPGSRPRGKVLLGITTTVGAETVVDYERCPLIPCRGDDAPEHSDDIGSAGEPFDMDDYGFEQYASWNLEPLGATDPWRVGETRDDPLRDVVDGATSLVRLSANQAAIHRDVSLSPYPTRLVYGGHTISLAHASLGRILSGFATVLGWLSCDHVAPVFEGDLLSSTHTLVADHAWGSGRIRNFQCEVFAHRDGGPVRVLDWRPVVYTT